MKFENLTKNTVYLQDIDKDIPFSDTGLQEIDIDDVKKSAGFRKMIQLGQFKIIECGNSIFEKNLLKFQETYQKIESKQETEMVPQLTKRGEATEVRIKGHFYDAGGYAKVNRNLAWGLSKAGVKVQIESSCNFLNDLNELEVRQLKSIQSPVSRDAIAIDSMIPTFGSQGFGPHRILYTTVEASTLPKQVVDALDGYDEIWTTSNFCKEVLHKYRPKRDIFVLPDSVNTDLYKENIEPYEFRPTLDGFIFVSVFGWGYRKGYDLLLRSYLEEFSGDEPVTLLVFSRYQSSTDKGGIIKKEISEYIKRYGGQNPAHIARCSRVTPEFQMPSIYAACNAFVLFSRGEGFGLPYCEASLCGIPVIGTNVSGQKMFLNHDNSYLIEPDEYRICPAGSFQVHYWENEVFPQLTSDRIIQDAREAMRDVYNNYKKAKKKNVKLQNFIKDNYNIKTVSLSAKDRLDKIWRNI